MPLWFIDELMNECLPTQEFGANVVVIATNYVPCSLLVHSASASVSPNIMQDFYQAYSQSITAANNPCSKADEAHANQ